MSLLNLSIPNYDLLGEANDGVVEVRIPEDANPSSYMNGYKQGLEDRGYSVIATEVSGADCAFRIRRSSNA